MNFFKRLLHRVSGRTAPARAEASAPGTLGREARKAPRINAGELENITFETGREGRTASIRIRNLSTTGAGLFREALERWPQRGETLSGELVFKPRDGGAEERFALEVRIVHISPTHVGCTFDRPSRDVASLLDRYFGIEISALQLRCVRADVLKPVPEGTPVWLTGPSHSEIYFVRSSEGEIALFEIMLFGNRIRGGRGVPTISDEGELPKGMHGAFRKLIESLDAISPEDRTRLLSVLDLALQK